jgi:hypothetical protein
LRWRIEKVFDTGKRKLEETKAWATGEVAREIQGHFFALTHNLLVIFRDYLKQEHGLEDEKLKQKRTKHLQAREQQARAKGRQVHPLHWKMPSVVQLSLQYIRTLRNHILTKTPLADSLGRLDRTLKAYL